MLKRKNRLAKNLIKNLSLDKKLSKFRISNSQNNRIGNKQKVSVFLSLLLLSNFSVSKTFAECGGFPNVPQTKGAFISGPFGTRGGRTAVVGYQDGKIVTHFEAPESAPGSDGVGRFFDISDLKNPKESTFGLNFNATMAAHGYLNEAKSFGSMPGQGWTFKGGVAKQVQVPEWFFGVPGNDQWLGRGLAQQPFGMSMYWTYGGTNYPAYLMKNGKQLCQINVIGETGVIGHPFLFGTTLYYASEGSMTGIAAYDVTDCYNGGGKAKLLGVVKGNFGGYWPEPWGGNGKLFLVNPGRDKGVSFADVTDPKNMKVVFNMPTVQANPWWKTPDPSYAQFQDNFLFTDKFKINMNDFSVDGTIASVENGMSVSQYALPIGNLIVTGGIQGPNNSQGLAIWASDSAPDKKGPAVSFAAPKEGQTNYPVAGPVTLLIHETLDSESIENKKSFFVRPVNGGTLGDPIDGRLVFAFDDILTFAPSSELKPNTTYEVELPQDGMKDAACNGMVAYKYRFSTGSAVEGGGTTPPPPAQATSTARPVEAAPTTKPTTPATVPTTAPVKTTAPVPPTPTKATVATAVPATPVPVNTLPAIVPTKAPSNNIPQPQIVQQGAILQILNLLIQLLQLLLLQSSGFSIDSSQLDLMLTKSFKSLSKKANLRALSKSPKERFLINTALYQYKACKKTNAKTKQVTCAKNSLKYLLKAQKSLMKSKTNKGSVLR